MSTDETGRFSQILSENGYRLTKARLSTFKLLLGGKPQSISELIEQGKGEVDRVSIYRNIDLFEKLGIVNRITIGWKYKIELSDIFLAHHHHMTCLGCGKTIDIEGEKTIDEFINQVASREGFAPERHTFEIEGYCTSCSINTI